MKRIQTAATLTCIRAGAGAIWVGSQYGDDVYRINPATNAVAVIHVGRGGEVCVDPHDDGVWGLRQQRPLRDSARCDNRSDRRDDEGRHVTFGRRTRP